MRPSGQGHIVIALQRRPVEAKVGPRSQPSREKRKPGNVNSGSVQTRHSGERGVCHKRISAWECQASYRYHAAHAEPKSIEQARAEDVRLVCGEHLAPRIVSCSLVIQFIGLPHVPGIEHVGAVKQVFFRKPMINLGREIVFRGHLLAGEGENTGITCSRNTRRERAQQSAIRERIKSGKKAGDLRVHCNCRCGAAVGRSA